MANQRAKTIIKDPFWDQTPELGQEALIATIQDHDELIQALKKNIALTKEKCKPKAL